MTELEKKMDMFFRRLEGEVNRLHYDMNCNAESARRFMAAMTRLNDQIITFLYEDTEIKFYLPMATFDILQQEIAYNASFHELDELKLLKKYLPPKPIIIDAGANIGNHSIFFAKICDAEKVFAFEPQKNIARICKINIDLNAADDQIVLVNAALGENCGRCALVGYEIDNPGGTVFKYESDQGKYDVVTVDSLQLEKVDFIKIDVEGCQLEVLKGAVRTIEHCHPVIFVEMNESAQKHTEDFYDHDHEVTHVRKLLSELGYVETEKMGLNDFVFTHPADDKHASGN